VSDMSESTLPPFKVGDLVTTDYSPRRVGKVYMVRRVERVRGFESGWMVEVGTKNRIALSGLDAHWFQLASEPTP
jgi:hypothetical protein